MCCFPQSFLRQSLTEAGLELTRPAKLAGQREIILPLPLLL